MSFDTSEFLEDSLQAVCLLVEDGLFLVFAHRSFQEYFSALFIDDSAPAIQRRLIGRVARNIGSDNVVGLLYEMNSDLVEREFLIPSLNKVFEDIGVKRMVGVSHYFRYLRSIYESITGNAKGHLHLSMVLSGSDFSGVVRFAVYGGRDFPVEPRVKFSRTKLVRFLKKHFGTKRNKTFQLSELSYRSPIIRDLSSFGGDLSIEFLRLAFQRKKELETKHSRVEQSLDELLSR